MHTPIPPKKYKAILEQMPICCVDIIILHQNRVLLVYRNTKPAQGVWWFPGGRVYKGETLREAVERKVREETGLKVRIIRQVGAYETIFKDGPFEDLKTGVHSVNVVYVVEPLDAKKVAVKVDATSKDFKWLSAPDATLPAYVQRVLMDTGVFG